MDNYQWFKHTFVTLQEVVAHRLGETPMTNFGGLLKIAKDRKDKVILTYYDKLNFYREFRNILEHRSVGKNEVIAMPSQTLITQMEEVINKIKYPKKVKDIFLKNVVSFESNDNLSMLLSAVNYNGYSQFPVFEKGKLVGIISENGITNFLAHSIEDDLISIKETAVKDVLNLDETKNAFSIISESKSIFDIETIFPKKVSEGNSAFLLLISVDGTIEKPEDITGIITPWDLPELIKNK